MRDRALLDMTDAAYYLHMTVEALRERVKQQQIPYLQLGKKIYFDIAELKSWMRGLSKLSAEEALTRTHPAQFPAPSPSEDPHTIPSAPEGRAPIVLKRGARRRHSLDASG